MNRTEGIETTIQRYMKQIIVIAAALLLFGSSSYAQGVTVSFDTVKAYKNDSVVIPVYVSGFTNIGAVTMYIQFDTAKLAWGRALSWNTGLNGNVPLLHHQHGVVGISWIDVQGTTLADGLFFEMKFLHKQGHAPIVLGASSEFANPNGVIIQHGGTQGLIWEALNLNPDTTQYTICLGSSQLLDPKPAGGLGALSYQWSSSDAAFSSTQSAVSVSPTVSHSYTVTVTDGIDVINTTFQVDIFPNISPAAPINLLPTDSTTGIHAPYTFSWSPSPHATLYDFYLWKATDPVPTQPTASNLAQINHTHSGTMLPGTWYKWKIVTKNSCYSTAGSVLNFETRALPNLNVTDVTTSQPLSGQPMTVSWTVTNNGLGPTVVNSPHSNWIDYIYLSPYFGIRLADQDYILLGQFPSMNALNPGASYVNTQTVQIPSNIMGPYFLFVFTDMYGAWPINMPTGVTNPPLPYSPPPFFTASSFSGSRVKETTESDNFHYSQVVFPVPPLADFATTSFITPSTVFSGQSVTLSYTVKNRGTQVTPANASWFDRVWISPDSILDVTTAVSLSSVQHNTPLDPDSSYTDTVTVSIPNNIFGTYYLFVQNDATNQVFENIGEDNNVRISNPINVILSPPADLMVAFINKPDSASIREEIEVSWTVINQGGMSTPQTGHWDAVYISQSDTFNLQTAIRLAKKKRNGSLAIGNSYTVTQQVTIPESFQGEGYLYVFTDVDDHVFEHTQEDNNIRRSDFPIHVLRPDFIPTAVIIPGTDSTGGNLTVQWVLNNTGAGDHVAGKNLGYRIYISSSPTWITDSMTVLETETVSGAILSGSTTSMNTTFKIPDGKPGPFYVYVRVNHTLNIPEEQITNNIARSINPIHIVRPDLVVAGIGVSPTMISGENATFTWTVKNDGGGMVNNRSWKDKIAMSYHPVYYPDSVIQIAVHPFVNKTILPGETLTTTNTFKIPHGHQGTVYFFVTTDIDDEVYEAGGALNNTSTPSSPVALTLGPWADLVADAITVQDTATQGDIIPVVFTIENAGTKAAMVPNGWKDKLYISSSHVWNSSNLDLMNAQTFTATLLPDSSYTINAFLTIPMTLQEGFYYFYVFTDAENKLYEYTDEGNNILRSDPIYIEAYPPIDLATTSVTAPSAANSGTPITVGWTVHNYGGGTTLAGHWFDGIYLSQDQIFSPQTDIYLGEKQRNGPLTPGNSYSTTHSVTVPNGTSGNWYLLVVSDRMDVHHDINRINNSGPAQAIAITLTPSPDLIISDFQAPTSAVAGQPAKIVWEVTNVGAGPTLSGGWIDRVYLSTDYTIDQSDKIFGSEAFSGSLAVGQSYRDSAEFFVPSVPTGNYILIIKTDNNNTEYEHNAEQNNTVTGMIFVNQPPPADLHVTSVTFPDSVIAGDPMTIDWTIKNSGSHPANGFMKDNLYLSADTAWNINDLYLGSVQGTISLQPLTQLSRSITVPAPGLTPGDYHIIVRTDANNNIFETNEENNDTVVGSPIVIDLPLLPIEVLLYDTLFNMTEKHYRVIIPDSLIGESMITYLKGDSANGVNELYMTHNRISTRMSHDYSHLFPYQANQDVMVPVLDSGSYYLLAFGHNTAAPYQEATLFADILEFEVRHIHDNKGGNKGSTTVLLLGSKFDSTMTVYLDSGGVIIPASALYYHDMTRALVTFNLHGALIGQYDLVATNSRGDSVRVEDGFRVIDGEGGRLGVSILHPANTRPNRISAFTVEYGNLGNSDLIAPVIRVTSLGGAPIAHTTEHLSLNQTELNLPLSIPGDPPNILRPGSSGSIVIYTISSTGLGILVTRE
jgi:subtilase family serine protease